MLFDENVFGKIRNCANTKLSIFTRTCSIWFFHVSGNKNLFESYMENIQRNMTEQLHMISQGKIQRFYKLSKTCYTEC